jgi:hypothetical protein
MADPVAKNIFAIVCLLGVVAVATVAALEVNRMRRGESLITPRQFRLRMISAVIWMVLLGSTAYAMLFLWPAPGDLVAGRHFLRVMLGVILLLLIALLLFIVDLMQLRRERRLYEMQFSEQLASLAQAEIERAQSQAAQALLSSSDRAVEAQSPSGSNRGGQTGGSAQ